jgi:hypothetical protein
MSTWAPIRYRGFWDVPRIFLVTDCGRHLLFDCPFDETIEDFPDDYRVYLMPPITEEELAGSWDQLSERALQYLGKVSIGKVRFDPSKRREIDTAILEDLTNRQTFPGVF